MMSDRSRPVSPADSVEPTSKRRRDFSPNQMDRESVLAEVKGMMADLENTIGSRLEAKISMLFNQMNKTSRSESPESQKADVGSQKSVTRQSKFTSERVSDAYARQVTFSSRRVNNLRFRTVENKLSVSTSFKTWKRSIERAIHEEDCKFVLDTDVPLPDCFTVDEIDLVTKKVKYYIESSLDEYYVDLIQDQDHPRDILDKLSRMREPTTLQHITALVDRLNS
ncbi:unnamed protein product, partial [Nesidiocoris tenuis]